MSTQASEVHRLIAEQIRQATPVQRVYNPSNEFVTAMVGGLIYTLPPDGYGKLPGEKEERKYDGILEVKDQWGVSAEERKLARQQKNRKARADKVILTALQVVSHLIAKLGNRGVVFLHGDGTDEARIEEAKETWATFHVQQSQQIVNAYNNRTRTWHLDPRNAGKFAPGMTEREIQAQEVLDAYQAGKLGAFRFICPERDGYGTNDEAKFELHMNVSHPASNHEAMSVEAPKRRGRPPKVHAEAQ